MEEDLAKPKCPSCGVIGKENIISENSDEESKGGDPWFNIAFCKKCGHVYGVFAKVTRSPSISIPEMPKIPKMPKLF